jgi:hypothetical protein
MSAKKFKALPFGPCSRLRRNHAFGEPTKLGHEVRLMPPTYVKQLESLLANRKQQRGIGGDFGSGRSISRAWAFTQRLDLDRGQRIGL